MCVCVCEREREDGCVITIVSIMDVGEEKKMMKGGGGGGWRMIVLKKKIVCVNVNLWYLHMTVCLKPKIYINSVC